MVEDQPLMNELKHRFGFNVSLRYDFPAGVVVFLVAVPLSLGIALASGAPLFSGLIAGIIGGLVVSCLSGSSLGVSGPAAGIAIIAHAAIQSLGFEAFLLSVVIAGVLQVIMGRIGAGIVGYYFPSAVISGMLTGIGIIIFLKQIPHAFGYDVDYEGDISFTQSDQFTTASELIHMIDFISPGAVIISLASLAILLLWESSFIKRYRFTQWIHGALAAVLTGVAFNQLLLGWFPELALSGNHLVSLPKVDRAIELIAYLTLPDFSQITNPSIYKTGFTLAMVASLETLLCVKAVDKLDPYKGVTPNNRELKAQGIGNICSGLLGGIPIAQVIVRSSANILSGGRSKASAFIHGALLLTAVILIPSLLNTIPLASLAAVLLVIGYQMADLRRFITMYRTGIYHFIPFAATVLGLIFTDMLTGIAIGMSFALFFILLENLKVGFYLHQEQKANKNFITLSENVSFLNKANILQLLDQLPENSEVVIDATGSKYIDFDVYEIIQNFKIEAERKNIHLVIENLRGYGVLEPLQRIHPLDKESQQSLTPENVLEILKAGNQRFVYNLKANRNLLEQVNETVDGQFPFAIILSCIDSRTSAELIFDQGLGDIFSVRVAGNIVNDDILGSMEFACKLAGSKLIVVLGHSHCGAIKGACAEAKLDHLTGLLNKIRPAVDSVKNGRLAQLSKPDDSLVEQVAERNVEIMVEQIRQQSPLLNAMANSGEIGIIGAMYNIENGKVSFFE
ncbi:MAG: carbonic anhydrase [Gammaproteobacteria bacterium HGW-Gammaproteobacteria-10]|nr:MAG: carbonic anhydrase [Gammaproteobacteria bacterium HGW-Gammaproteobacteria-10]